MGPVRILLADGHAAVRKGLRSLLESGPDRQVFEAATELEAIEQTRRLAPDVLLLDVTLFEAAQPIRRDQPHAHLLLLTVDPTDEVTEQVRQAGAMGALLKSDARGVNAAIDSLFPPASIHLAGAEVGRERHVAAFFRSQKERYQILGPFIAEGLARGEKAFHIVDPGDRDAHLHALLTAGIDVDAATAHGRMEVVPWESMYLAGGRFDQDAMLARLRGVLETAAAEGYPLARAIGHMEWALLPPPTVAELVEYESCLNEVLAPFDDLVVCAYDITKFNAEIILDILLTHPAVIVAGTLYSNPFYIARDGAIPSG